MLTRHFLQFDSLLRVYVLCMPFDVVIFSLLLSRSLPFSKKKKYRGFGLTFAVLRSANDFTQTLQLNTEYFKLRKWIFEGGHHTATEAA